MNRGAIILCGGRSLRMGRDKALLPFGPQETLLQRVVRIVSAMIPPERIVCVAAARQELPTLPAAVRVVRDTVPDCGPLAGLALGLAALEGKVDGAFACGCDTPLLKKEFVERLFELLGDHEAAVPRENGQLHPLPAVYRTNLLSCVRSLLTSGERSLVALLATCDARFIDRAEFRDVDLSLSSLQNCNTSEEYDQALTLAFPKAE